MAGRTDEESSPLQQPPSQRPSDAKSPTMAVPSKKLPQFIAALVATIGAFSLGNSVGWSSPALPNLEKSGDLGNITVDEKAWIGSIVPVGAAISTLFSGFVIDIVGRKLTLLILGVPFIGGWLLIAFAQNVGMMMGGRFITGFCGGAFSMIVGVYTSEIAESSIRGICGTFMILQLVSGILFVYVVGALTSWFWLSIICSIVPAIFLVSMIVMPESPTFLVMKGQISKAEDALFWFRRSTREQVKEEIGQIQRNLTQLTAEPFQMKDLISPVVYKPFGICLALMFFQQFCGISAVLFYSVEIFKSAGSTMNENVSAIIIAIVQVIFAGISTSLVEKAGRKILMIVSLSGCVVGLIALGTFFYMKEQNNDETPEGLGWLPLTSLMVFMVSYNLGLGGLPWCLLSELIGGRVKSLASSIAASFVWFLVFLVAKYYADVGKAIGLAYSYWLFALFSFVGVLFSVFIVPETKGKSLEEIQKSFL